jgi:LmbE family N-acetylglucosaminyl deacetylase
MMPFWSGELERRPRSLSTDRGRISNVGFLAGVWGANWPICASRRNLPIGAGLDKTQSYFMESKTVGILLGVLLTGQFLAMAQDSPKSDIRRNLLIMTCHPDDWELGMAGTAYLLKDKYQIHVAIASDGELGNTWNTTGKPDPEMGALRAKHAAKSAEKIQAINHFLKMRDGGVYADENAVNRMVGLLKEIDPAIIFLHWPIDKPDHAAASAMSMMALAKTGMMYNKEIYFFAVGELEHFTPEIYVDITPIWNIKMELVRIHERFNDDRFQKMAEESAVCHGLSNHCKFAEGFIPLSAFSNVKFKNRIGCSLLGL